jgi:hypothetical protein
MASPQGTKKSQLFADVLLFWRSQLNFSVIELQKVLIASPRMEEELGVYSQLCCIEDCLRRIYSSSDAFYAALVADPDVPLHALCQVGGMGVPDTLDPEPSRPIVCAKGRHGWPECLEAQWQQVGSISGLLPIAHVAPVCPTPGSHHLSPVHMLSAGPVPHAGTGGIPAHLFTACVAVCGGWKGDTAGPPGGRSAGLGPRADGQVQVSTAARPNGKQAWKWTQMNLEWNSRMPPCLFYALADGASGCFRLLVCGANRCSPSYATSVMEGLDVLSSAASMLLQAQGDKPVLVQVCGAGLLPSFREGGASLSHQLTTLALSLNTRTGGVASGAAGR